MNEDNRPDIDVGTIGTGCATGCGLGCLQLVLIIAFIAVSGVQITRGTTPSIPSGVRFLSFLVSLGCSLLVGYVTARKAPHSKMLHAIIVGALALLFGILGVVFNPKTTGHTPWNIFSFMLSIPLTMLGAHWAISTEKQE